MTASPTRKVARLLRERGLTVHSRKAWGSTHEDTYEWRRVHKRAPQGVSLVVQHITDTNPTKDFLADVRLVERIGMERFQTGISYNWIVNMTTGEVAIGQPLDAKGSHTVNAEHVEGWPYDLNASGRAIAVLGNPETHLTPRGKYAIRNVLRAMVDTGAIRRGFEYLPHSHFARKDCPCDSTRDAMHGIRQAVAAPPFGIKK